MYPPQHVNSGVADPWSAPAAQAQGNEPIPEIFIGRIPPTVSKEALEAHFVPYGATNFRVLEGKGCAFCSFASWAAAETAVQALNGLKFEAGSNEGINVKFADVRAQGAPKNKSQLHPKAWDKVFIGNIGPQATEDVVREVCQQFGFVTNTKIFARSADAKPCAFVTFTSFSEAELCISALNGVEHAMAVDGKVLNVRLADAIGRKGGANAATNAPNPNVQGLGMPAPGSMTMPFPPPPGAGMVDRPGAPLHDGLMGTSGGTGPKVFIGGLPEAATEDFVWGMMAPFGEVTEAKIHRKQGAKPCGFARFAQPGEAEHAIAMLGDNGRYTVRQADDLKSGGAKRAMMDAQQEWEEPAPGWGDDMYGGARTMRRLT